VTDKPQGEPKQKTPKGLEIPVPKRSEIMDAFKKIIGGQELRCHVCGEPVSRSDYMTATVLVDGKRVSAVIHQGCR
jgi:hypothetical protein